MSDTHLALTHLILLTATTVGLVWAATPAAKIVHAEGPTTPTTQASATIRYVDDSTGQIVKSVQVAGTLGSSTTYQVAPPAGYTVRGGYQTVTFRFTSTRPGTMTFHLVKQAPVSQPQAQPPVTPKAPVPAAPAKAQSVKAKAMLAYVDAATGKVLGYLPLNGIVGQSITVTLHAPAGYTINGKTTFTYHFTTADAGQISIQVSKPGTPAPAPVAHGLITVRFIDLLTGKVLYQHCLQGVVGQPLAYHATDGLKHLPAGLQLAADATTHGHQFTAAAQHVDVYVTAKEPAAAPAETEQPEQPKVVMPKAIVLSRPALGKGPDGQDQASAELAAFFVSLSGKINFGMRG